MRSRRPRPLQTKFVAATKAKYIEISALKNAENNNSVGYAEIDVITK